MNKSLAVAATAFLLASAGMSQVRPAAQAPNPSQRQIRPEQVNSPPNRLAIANVESSLTDEIPVTAGGGYFENTAKVVPPEQGCPNGRIALVVGQPRPGMILHRPLYNANGQIDITSPTIPFQFPVAAESPATDNQIIRLKDGSLLAIKDSYIWARNLTPQPEWFNETVNGYANLKAQRAGELMFHSADCGVHWVSWATLDFASVVGGKYGYPRPVGQNGQADVAPAEQGTNPDKSKMWWVGGADRTEIYACPFTGNIYLTTRVISGPFKNVAKQNTTLLFYSKDNAKSWELITDSLPAWSPTVMTSTPNGRLFLLQQLGSVPTVYFSLGPVGKGKPQMSQGYPVGYSKNGYRVPALGARAVSIRNSMPTPTVSRFSTDTKSSKIRVAYGSRNSGGNQEASVIDVDVQDPKNPPVVSNVAIIEAADAANQSVLYFTFIDPDYVEMPATVRSNTSMLYWLEAPRQGFAGPYGVRYTLFRDDLHTNPSYLSVEGGHKKTWTTPVDIGDYMAGGFFWDKNSLHYVAQWVDPSGIRANIVTAAY